MRPLPRLMVAPNGAWLGKADHPALPLSVAEIVACAQACHGAGADAVHAHVRDARGRHRLDAGLYRELLAEMASVLPHMAVQITTEAAGRYAPASQRALIRALCPAMVSIAYREIMAEPEMVPGLLDFCAEAGVAVQFILYDAADIAGLGRLAGPDPVQVLHVLGRRQGPPATPAMLAARLAAQRRAGLQADWAACAFGPAETDCLIAAHAAGGKLRVGFENSLTMQDGTRAPDNAARVAEVARLTEG